MSLRISLLVAAILFGCMSALPAQRSRGKVHIFTTQMSWYNRAGQPSSFDRHLGKGRQSSYREMAVGNYGQVGNVWNFHVNKIAGSDGPEFQIGGQSLDRGMRGFRSLARRVTADRNWVSMITTRNSKRTFRRWGHSTRLWVFIEIPGTDDPRWKDVPAGRMPANLLRHLIERYRTGASPQLAVELATLLCYVPISVVVEDAAARSRLFERLTTSLADHPSLDGSERDALLLSARLTAGDTSAVPDVEQWMDADRPKPSGEHGGAFRLLAEDETVDPLIRAYAVSEILTHATDPDVHAGWRQPIRSGSIAMPPEIRQSVLDRLDAMAASRDPVILSLLAGGGLMALMAVMFGLRVLSGRLLFR